MNHNTKLLTIGNFNINFGHLLIILVISLSFSTSFLIRTLPGSNGWELNEFDPFFNYRATDYLLKNGLIQYLDWNDELSWYPTGRDISSNSQVMLHITTASAFSIFNFGMSLYEFTIIFPVIVGSLTTIVIFALTRVISNTTAGLFASLLFSISLPILVRGSLGWFKSEPLGLFLGILGTYLFLSAVKDISRKKSYVKFGISGIILLLGISAWGGNQFFIFPISLLIFCLPFLKKDNRNLKFGIIIFTTCFISFSAFFERPGLNFFSEIGGFLIILPSIFQFICFQVQKFSNQTRQTKNSLIILFIMLVIIGIIFSLNEQINFIDFPTHRYLNSVFPLLTTTDPLTDSVSEHATLTLQQSFQFHSILMIFAAMGVWLIFEKNNKKIFTNIMMKVYLLILSFFGLYISSAFMRLEVFGALAIIILSSIGLVGLIKIITDKSLSGKNQLRNYSLMIGVMIILFIPLFLPTTTNVLAVGENLVPTILNGGSNYQVSKNDWIDSLEWIKNNTPENSVIASWWDYGYWIQSLADRKTLVDNSTLIDSRIKKIANSFFENPNDAWLTLRTDLGADYFLVFITGEKLPYVTNEEKSLYILGGGGDESKKYWFTKISKYNTYDFLYQDNFSGTDKFWNDTFLGKITPFKRIGFVDFNNDQISQTFVPGWIPVYEKEIKFIDDNQPFKLVYSSPSYENDEIVIGVFIYEINKNYVPIN